MLRARKYRFALCFQVLSNQYVERSAYAKVFKFNRENKRCERAKVNYRCLHWFPAAMLVSLRRAPTWRSHTKHYNFHWYPLPLRDVKTTNTLSVVNYSLVQAGKRLLGIQLPDAPQTHTLESKGWAKSDLLLQKGEQSLPSIQSSQARAPFPLGGGRSLHSVAACVKKVTKFNKLVLF